jgi:hypothetical protein
MNIQRGFNDAELYLIINIMSKMHYLFVDVAAFTEPLENYKSINVSCVY